MITIKLIVWLLLIAFNVYLDRNGRKPDYLVTGILRGIAAILYLGLIWDVQGGYSLWTDFKEFWSLLLFMGTSYWLFFEVGLNYLRIKPLLYYDRIERDSGWIDRFFADHPKLHTPAKIFALCLMILALIDIYAG